MHHSREEQNSSVAAAPTPAESQGAESAGIETILAQLSQVLASARPFAEPTRSEPQPSADESSVEVLPSIEDRYRVLVEQIPAVVFMAMLEGGVTEAYVSPQIEKVLGFSREEWLDDPIRWYQQIHPDDRYRWSIDAAEMFMRGTSLKAAYRVIARDGRVVWFHCEAKLVRRKDGQPWFIHGVGFDITELKQTEEALQQEIRERERLQRQELEQQIAKAEHSESRLAAIVESSEDAIMSKTLDGIITSWNASATRLFGYEAKEIIGESVLLLVPPELHEQEMEILRRLRGGERVAHQETQRVGKSGKRVDVSLTISPVRNAAGEIIGASTITRDISARKQAEEALRISEKLAATGRLAATIAHEINNPLEAIGNLVYLAKRHPQRAAYYLDIAEQELDRVGQITKQTLGFYRENASVGSVDLATVLDDILLLYGKKLRRRQIEIKREYDEGITVEGFGGEIRRIFANLVGNAIDAMPNGGVLWLRSSKLRHWSRSNVVAVRISVADTGSGIEREHMKKIFSPFYTTKKEVGTGLGLWLTKNLVEHHGGAIKVRSRTEGGRSGTVFSVILPEHAAIAANNEAVA